MEAFLGSVTYEQVLGEFIQRRVYLRTMLIYFFISSIPNLVFMKYGLVICDNCDLKFSGSYEDPLKIFVKNVEKNMCSTGDGLIHQYIGRSFDNSYRLAEKLVVGCDILMCKDGDFADPKLIVDLNGNHSYYYGMLFSIEDNEVERDDNVGNDEHDDS